MGQHAGISVGSPTEPSHKVGQHARITPAKSRTHLSVGGSTCRNIECRKTQTIKTEVGQHAGMMGQHKQEWWVNMRRNLHAGSEYVSYGLMEIRISKPKIKIDNEEPYYDSEATGVPSDAELLQARMHISDFEVNAYVNWTGKNIRKYLKNS